MRIILKRVAIFLCLIAIIFFLTGKTDFVSLMWKDNMQIVARVDEEDLCVKMRDATDTDVNAGKCGNVFTCKGHQWKNKFSKKANKFEIIKNGSEVLLKIELKEKINASFINEVTTQNIQTNFKFKGKIKDIYKILLQQNLSVIKKEVVSSVEIWYVYSPNLNSPCHTIENKKHNLQISFDGENITMGAPVILCDY